MRFKDYIGKKNFRFTRRGNISIKNALRMIDYERLLMQDQGGWITYSQYGKNIIKLNTRYGIVDPKDLLPDSALIINSLPGYHSLQDMGSIMHEAKKKNIIVINDVTGSIPYKEAIVGDIIIGSFGRWKPMNLGSGGFIASDMDLDIDNYDLPLDKIEELFLTLNERVSDIMSIKKRVISDLGDDYIGDEYGYNLIYDYDENIIRYCEENDLEYVICPKEIRIMKKAISIEIKRKF